MQHPDIWQLLQGRAHPDQPFVTVVDGDGRVELSGKTLMNGIAKSANAFRDVLDTDPGDPVLVNLGWTWQQSVWQGAALIAGLHLIPTLSTRTEVLSINSSLISTHPLGLPAGGPDDITQEVLGQPDAWMYPEYFPEQHELIERVRAWAKDRGIAEDERVGIVHTNQTDSDTSFYGPFLLPLISSGSVVFITAQEQSQQTSTEHIDSIMKQEKITRLLQP
jgi:uncharacterized protein (TIGR03089 family)